MDFNAKGMMPTAKIGYVDLHRPGRWTKFSLLFFIIFATVLGVTITQHPEVEWVSLGFCDLANHHPSD